MLENWTLCDQNLPNYNKLVLLCLDVRDKTVLKGWLELKENTPLGIDMWRLDGVCEWYEIEDMLAWYDFPRCQHEGSSKADILPITKIFDEDTHEPCGWRRGFKTGLYQENSLK